MVFNWLKSKMFFYTLIINDYWLYMLFYFVYKNVSCLQTQSNLYMYIYKLIESKNITKNTV